jgi:tetratricopeptide (TPR) repeat protein
MDVNAPPDAARVAAAGWARLRAGDSQGAIRDFKAALAIDPEHVDSLIGLCQALLNTGDLAGAENEVKALMRVSPLIPAAHRLRALVVRRRHRPREALKSARQAVALDPREPFGYHVLAACLHGLNRRREALKIIAEGREIAPGYVVLAAQQARLVLETRGARAAEPLIEAALKLDLDSDYVLVNAGLILLARGRLQEARNLLGETLRHDASQEEAISLYLLTDPRKYRLLRAVLQFRYWQREKPVVGGVVWVGAWAAFLLATGLLVGATQMSAGVVGLAYGLFWRTQYGAHRREVRAHFVAPKLKPGF